MFLDLCHQFVIKLYLTQIQPVIKNYQTKFKNNKYYQYCETMSVNIYSYLVYFALYGYTQCQIIYQQYLSTSQKAHTVWLGYLDYLENDYQLENENNPPLLNYHHFLTENPEVYHDRQLIYQQKGITGILLPTNTKMETETMTQFDFTNECLSASLIINDKEVEITEYFNNYARVKQNKGKKLNIYYLVDSKGENIVKQIDSKITIINTDAKKITYTDIITF